MKPEEIAFSVEKDIGEDSSSIFIYFSDDVRVKVADSYKEFLDVLHQFERIRSEIYDNYKAEVGA